MGLLKVIEDAPGYAKVNMQGPQGSGKSRTAAEIACTIHKIFKSKKPIAYYDSETGSDFLADLITERVGMKPLRVKTRAFSQLLDVLNECRQGASDILIVDSITHVWRELQTSYMQRMNENLRYPKTRMDIQDIMRIKELWEPWPNDFLNSPLHIIVCGREGNEWGHEEDEEGKKQLVAVGKKMKVEGEFGYEAGLIIAMSAYQIEAATIRNKRTKQVEKRPRTIVNVATVLKDRWDVMNGEVFEMPTGDDFMPYLEKLRPDLHRPVDTASHTSETLPESDGGYMREKTDRAILVEKIQAEITGIYGGQTVAEKKGRSDLMKQFFQTQSWTEIEKRVDIGRLGEGYALLQAHAVEQQRSAEAATSNDPDGKVEAQAAFA